MVVATTMRCFWKRILKRTGDFKGHAQVSEVDAQVSVIHQGLCRMQMILPEKNEMLFLCHCSTVWEFPLCQQLAAEPLHQQQIQQLVFQVTDTSAEGTLR